jgi:FkbM family methyltransferase
MQTKFVVKYIKLILRKVFSLALKIIWREGPADPSLYVRLKRLGFLWDLILWVIQYIHIDSLILAPSKYVRVLIPASLTWEPEVMSVFRPRKGEIVVDVGAQVGRYSIITSKLVQNEGKVIAIEPEPLNFKLLEANIQLHKAENIIPVKCALTDTEGYTKLWLGKTPGWHSCVTDSKANFTGDFVNVRCMTLDSLLRELGIQQIDWLKIDVEGAELIVLRGGLFALKNSKNLKIIIEVNRNSSLTLGFLKMAGYTCKFLTETEILAFRKSGDNV